MRHRLSDRGWLVGTRRLRGKRAEVRSNLSAASAARGGKRGLAARVSKRSSDAAGEAVRTSGMEPATE